MISRSRRDSVGGGGGSSIEYLNSGSFLYNSGRPGDHAPFLETPGNSGRLGRSALDMRILLPLDGDTVGMHNASNFARYSGVSRGGIMGVSKSQL